MGKSGSFFFFNHDKTLLLKTMTEGDFASWTKLFPYYFKHINENENNSLLARVYGVYSIKIEGTKPFYLILQGSTANSAKRDNIQCTFDLKGSLIDREEKKDLGGILKDTNLLNLKSQFKFLKFREDDIKLLNKTIE